MNGRKIAGIILVIICVLACTIGGGGTEAIYPSVIFGVIGLVLIFKKPKTKEEKQKKQKELENKREYEKVHMDMFHVAGLPIAEGTPCVCGMESELFEFSGSGNKFHLHFDKITSIDIKTDVEIQKQYVSSIGGAIGGAILFGPLGAIVGGRAKQKKSKEITYYLIFTYLKDGNVDYISFEVPQYNLTKVNGMKQKFDKDYKKDISKTIEL